MKNLPPLHNVRAGTIWSFIEPHVDFTDKTVCDYGCGYADIIARAALSGAKAAWGYEGDANVFQQARQRMRGIPNLSIVQTDIEKLVDIAPARVNIGICTSVLPYLKHPTVFLQFLSGFHREVIIEMQYATDGPGPAHITNDEDMINWLTASGFDEITRLGATLVEPRNRYRSVFLCKPRKLT